MKRRLNLLALVILLAATSAASAAVYFVHESQVRRNIHVLLDQATRSEEAGDLAKAREKLRRYLGYRREDAPTWKRYASLMERLDSNGRNRDQVLLAYQQALRLDPADQALSKKYADLALRLDRFAEARRQLLALLKRLPEGNASGKDRAELQDSLAQCDQGQSKTGEAEALYRKAIADDPTRVETYNRLARLLRTERNQPDAAEQPIEAMVSANPAAGRAYLLRWQYHRDFQPPADPADAWKAFELSGTDPDAVLAAAIVAEEKGDTTAAQQLLKTGQTLAPKRSVFPIRLARIESTAGRLAEAEKILRQAQQQLSVDIELAFLLTENLISQGKLDGKDEARAWLVTLRDQNLNDGFLKYLEGRLAMRKSDWATAIARLNAARSPLARDPVLTNQLNLLLAQCYQQVQQPAKAIAALERTTPDPTTQNLTRPLLAALYEADGALDKARIIHLALAESRPESRLDIARILLIQELGKPEPQRNWTEVERRLADAEKALPAGNVPLALLRANLLSAQNKLADARKLLDQTVRQHPDDLNARLAQVRAAVATGNNEEALKLLDQAERDLGPRPGLSLARFALDSAPGGLLARQAIGTLDADRKKFPADEQPPLLEALAVASYRQGDRDAAIGYWEQLLNLQPDSPIVLQLLIDASLESDKIGRVPALLDRLKTLDGPEGVRWRQAEAVYRLNLMRRNQANEAAAVLRLASEIADRDPESWVPAALRGQLAETQGQPEKAISEYRKAVDLGCTQPNLARQLVALLYQRGEFDAIDQMMATLRKNGAEPADLTLVEAMNRLRRGDVDGALELARRTLPDTSSNALDHVFIGRMLVYAGRYADAEPAFQRALKLAPADPDALISYIECLARMRQVDKARDLLNKTALALPADRADLILARGYDLLNDGEAAAKAYDQALARSPNDPATLRAVLDFNTRIGALDKAKELLARLEAAAGDQARPLINRIRSQSLLRSGELADLDQAVALVDQNLKASPLSFDDQKLRAILLSMRPSQRKESIRQLEALDERRLLEPSEQFLLASLYQAAGDLDRCEAMLQKVLASPRGRDPRFIAFAAVLALDRGNLELADKRLAELRQIVPPDAPAIIDLESRLLRARGDQAGLLARIQAFADARQDQTALVAGLYERYEFLDQAERAYRAFVAEKPDEPLRPLVLAGYLAGHGKTDEALAICDKAWAACPPEAVAETAVGVITSARDPSPEQIARVEGWLTRALEANPTGPALLVKMGTFRSFRQDYDQAERLYRKVIEADPSNIEALNNLAWLLAYRDPQARGREALDLITRAIELFGSVPALLDTRAMVSLQTGRMEAAFQDLKAALVAGPEIPVLYFHLALAHAAEAHTAEAREALVRAHALGLKIDQVDVLERDRYTRLVGQLKPEEATKP